MEVKDLNPILIGPTSVCPLIDEFTYTLEDTANMDRVSWEISGGVILEKTPNSVKVKWGAPNPNAKLTATPYTDQGCLANPWCWMWQLQRRLSPPCPLAAPDYVAQMRF